jgi:hypothetical protein
MAGAVIALPIIPVIVRSLLLSISCFCDEAQAHLRRCYSGPPGSRATGTCLRYSVDVRLVAHRWPYRVEIQTRAIASSTGSGRLRGL